MLKLRVSNIFAALLELPIQLFDNPTKLFSNLYLQLNFLIQTSAKPVFFSMQLFLTQKITLCISIYVQIQYTFCIITSHISISQILKAKSNVININAPFAASSIAAYFHSSQECGQEKRHKLSTCHIVSNCMICTSKLPQREMHLLYQLTIARHCYYYYAPTAARIATQV